MKRLRRLLGNFLLSFLSDKKLIELKYYLNFKKKLNLKNVKTYNEKIQWLKLYDRTSLHTLCADKLKVREYIKEVIGEEYLIPLVFSTENVEEIVPENLPDYPIIIKTNHDSGTYFIIRDKEKENWKVIRSKLKKALNRSYYKENREWQYKNIKPYILVEKLLLTASGKVPQDLKFHCFNSEVKFIQVDIDRETNHSRSLFNTNWDLLDFGLRYPSETYIKRPTKLELLLKLAKKISSKFILARVDFYEFENEIYFGEITFHPGSGFEKFIPEKKDLEFGDLLKLPHNNERYNR